MQKIYKVISQMPDQSHLCSSCKFSKELVRWMAITPKYRKVQNSLISPKNQFNTQYHIVHANNIFSREATFYQRFMCNGATSLAMTARTVHATCIIHWR